MPPLPKERRSRDRDNKPKDRLVIDDVVRGPDLPTEVPGDEGGEWHPLAVQWWEAFRRSPQAIKVEDDVQWYQLIAVLVLLHDAMVTGARGRQMRLAEFRLAVSNYFITPADLRRGRMEIVQPELDDDIVIEGDDAKVTSLKSRRSRLSAG